MMIENIFCSEVELGALLGSLDIISDAYGAVLETCSTYQFHLRPSGLHVLAFQSSDDYTRRFLEGECGLVSSKDFSVVEFINSGVNASFSINKAVVEFFEHLTNLLTEFENKHIHTPLVVTGQYLGGYLAMLFTIWLQRTIDEKESVGIKNNKRPICITFGSPLVGDEALQCAISDRQKWKSSFLNVVSIDDHIASFFSSNSRYKPFGTFLFCTESGGHAAFEDHEAILEVLDLMASSNTGNYQKYDYKSILNSITSKALYRGASNQVGEFNMSLLREGITLQFREVGLLDNLSNDLIDKMVNKQENQKKTYKPRMSLNRMKESMANMEGYIYSRRSKGGYYDCYKNERNRNEIDGVNLVIRHHVILNKYWEENVEINSRMPQKEGANLRKRWLYSGNNYKRMIEPLDIAKHYRKFETNYITTARSNHYKLLEKWWNDDKKDLNPNEKMKAPNLNIDSCFWAHVEEAVLALRDLKNGRSSRNREDIKHELEHFMAYVMQSIKDYLVSSDIFLEGSSLMKWWNEYNTYKRGLCYSEFSQYMKSGRYKSYQ
ncbi:alpha/Beta hydrolase fold protein [Artemisia annua]|uniref:Alpha/Beta hydrolase fold protein n=1 Tax=Artemisia annua TaxID=35608 RepID=A0A2U1Q6U9_ARTAN|nr:alpha/Beta hydrolase fold protein [Artemisia annua]